MVDSFCESFYIPAEVYPTASGRDKTIAQFLAGVLEKDSAPHPTARQEQTVKLLESHKAPFRRYPECFLCLVGLSPYYPFDENSYPAFERPDGTDMGLLDFIKTADPRKVRAVEVQKGDDQVTLLESTRHCFMPLVIPAAGGSSSVAATEIPAPTEGGQEDVAEENAYLELADPDEGTAMVRQSEEEVVTERPKKIKKKRPTRQSDVLPAKKLRTDHPSLASGTGGKTLAGLEQIMPAGSRLLAREHSSTLSAPVDTAAATTTSTKAKLAADVNPDLAGPSQLEESEGSDDSFYELATFHPSEAKRWYVPRWNITNDSLLDDGFSCRTLVDRVAPPAFFASLRSMDCDQLYTEFNVGAARQICLGSEVRSRAEHELELKEKLNAKYAARGKLLEEKDSEILRLKSQLAEKEAEAAKVIRLRDQVSSLSREKSTLTAEVSALKVTITQKDNDISLLDSRATHLASSLDDAKVACAEAGTKITSLASERDRLASEVSSLRAGFQDFKEKMEVQQEKQAQELYNRVAELEAQVMDGILGHALGRVVDFGMQEGLEAGHEHGVAGRSLSVVDAYNPDVSSADYVNAVKALEDAHFPLVDLLKSKKDAGMDECIEQLSIPIHHAGDKMTVKETSLSFALMNVHARAEGATKHAVTLRQLMMEIVSAPLSSQT
ncbi:hypothetical protein Tco_0600029 [Tanacetum coccineum]|uniref:Transposase (Putative), gypsy type n=1 Tax=Tanacetum coccineum TaxID=301880 RepID=A0ABQ4WAL9_9ASTR